jgi:membrane glycosyltransferase
MSGIPTPFSNMQRQHQPIRVAGQSRNLIHIPGETLRRVIFFIAVAATVIAGVWMMFEILAANDLMPLEVVLLILFSITFGWIATAFWSGACGFVLQMLRLDPLTLQRIDPDRYRNQPVTTRTAVVMPVYNEDTHRVIAGFEATLRSLDSLGEMQHFDFYLLSDTTNADVAKAELAAWNQLSERLGDLRERIFYRRREKNIGRKVGNLMDFCQRWGCNYAHMIVLDADSIMSGDCLLQMVRAMQANPRAGLIQTVPIPVRQTTFFGRFVQFAAVLYSPMLATGLCFWQTNAANYWGHNAIIRMRAFIDYCGLPSLPGKAPFGGDILSHDFVEAAMLRRAGWDVFLLADLEGSYEEVPCNIIDYAKRDRRWVQGNIQHLGLLNIAGMNLINRLHFLFGAIAYITSLIWLGMLVLSTADAVIRSINSNVYFSPGVQLFPDWPIAKTGLIVSLITLTIALLLLPKVLGIIVAITHRNAEFGGTWAIIKGAFIETLFAILIAPIMMVFHAYFVVSVFLGFKVNWDAQEREGRLLPWSEAFARTARTSLVAIVWGALTYYYAPIFFWWLTPILTGLVLAAPIVRYSSSIYLGKLMQRLNIFLSPSETQEDPVLQEMKLLAAQKPQLDHSLANIPSLPADTWTEMPVQNLKQKPV